ncbi:hypothetical protein [Rufibacter roseus]|uniref:Uncharacterized protein n=1 Tax=Rufibacter roseus TaxID=1567108 RepID=A0ABW2DUI9_9BACT|nr:hypothetical protein [Rufibacter roseus]
MLDFIKNFQSEDISLKKVRNPDISVFKELTGKEGFKHLATYEVSSKRNRLYLCVAQYQVYFPNRYKLESPYKTDYYLYGFLRLDDSIGKVFMRPETTADKITELFKKQELDFSNHKIFSRKYYLLASDHRKVSEKFSTRVLDALSSIDTVLLECNLKRFLFSIDEKPATEESFFKLIELGLVLDKSLNKPQIMWVEKYISYIQKEKQDITLYKRQLLPTAFAAA